MTTATDAIVFLIEDHQIVRKLFRFYQALVRDGGTASEKAEVATQICRELEIHAQLEEEIFYPAMREATDEADLMDEAIVEHRMARDLITQIESASPRDVMYDAMVVALGEYFDHHVKEEESELFPEARKSIDVDAVGTAMKSRKDQLRFAR
jgi:hemerythrin-like domain-containing protein